MRFPRSSGILCHLTSLPARHGVGDLGMGAYQWIDFLVRSGQRHWQVLPLVPPSEGDSPYSGYSAMAGNPLMISLDALAEQGLLDQSQTEPVAGLSLDASQVDYVAVVAYKRERLKWAFEAFCQGQHAELQSGLDAYVARTPWLKDFSRFEALMRHFDQPDWSEWPDELVHRDPETLQKWDLQLADEIKFSQFQQFIFDRQWNQLKSYASEHHISLYGDMPIFVAHQSADVWANQSLFALHEDGRPELVAGVPPDYFSKTGQLWGNPQYRWDALDESNYAWWTERFRVAFEQFDILRIDHFRGFEAYWEVLASAKTAVGGKWVKGPGAAPFRAAFEVLGELPMIAEDLGMITDEVHHLRNELGFPGMRVLQFGFDSPEDDFHRPSAYEEHCVAYTGTHDNDTLIGWYRSRKPANRDQDPLDEILTDEAKADEELAKWQIIREVLKSKADIAIVPIQDFLGLGNDARMNVPGKAKGNWSWRLVPGMIDDELADQIRAVTETAGRLP